MKMGWFKGVTDPKQITAHSYNGWWAKLQSWWNDHDSGVDAWTVVNANAYKRSGIPQASAMQVVTFSTTSATSSATASFADTALTASITPASINSVILILAAGNLRLAASSYRAYVTIKRGSTNIGDATFGFTFGLGATASSQEIPCSVVAFDSPSAVVSTTYTLQIKSDGAATTIWNDQNAKSTLVLVEIQP